MRGKVNRKSSADVKSADMKEDNISHLNVSNPKNKYYRLVMDVKKNRRTQLQINSQQFFSFLSL